MKRGPRRRVRSATNPYGSSSSTSATTIKLDVDIPDGTVLQYTASKSTASPRSKRVVNGKLRIESVRLATRGSWLEITQ